jgi:hypothetical protein
MYKLGDYIFTIAPNKRQDEVEYVGADVITLSGRQIFQPSYYKKNLNLSSIIWQPMPKTLSSTPLSVDFIGMDTNNIFMLTINNKLLQVFNYNFVLLNQLTLTVDLTGCVGIGVGADYFYILTAPNSIILYIFNKNNLALVETRTLSFINSVQCFTAVGDKIYIIDGSNNIVLYDVIQATSSLVGRLPFVVGGYQCITYQQQGFFLVTNFFVNKSTWYVFDVQKLYLVDTFVFNDQNKGIFLGFIDKNNVYFYDTSKYLWKIYLNLVECDLFLLKKALSYGSVNLVDNYNRTIKFNIDNMEIKRLSNLFKAYEVNLTGFTIM